MIEALKGAEFFEPVDSTKQMAGQKIEFTTTDLDGNTVTSEELFSANEITMLNCWGTWCPHCIDEMAELVKIHESMQKKGCGIVGLEKEDNLDEATKQKARDMMKEWGTNYPNVVMPSEIASQVPAYPTSIFVDKEGNVLGVPIVGAQLDRYESRLDALLADKKAGKETAPETEEVVTYSVIVTDENGPVAEVAVQCCNDTTCRFGETDENGVATFEIPVGEFHVQVLEVPDGYEEDDTLYYPTEGSGEIKIQLKKSA